MSDTKTMAPVDKTDTWLDLPVDVFYEYEPAQNDEPAQLKDFVVLHNGHDITEILSEEDYDGIYYGFLEAEEMGR